MAPSRFMLLAGTLLFIFSFLASADEGCMRNEIKARAPNIFKVVHPVTPGFFIRNVSLGQRHSFYMCESGDNFGFNTSHWWVSKGCSATFILTECPSSDGTLTGTTNPGHSGPVTNGEMNYLVRDHVRVLLVK